MPIVGHRFATFACFFLGTVLCFAAGGHAALSIISITPNTVGLGGGVPVTIRGTGFPAKGNNIGDLVISVTYENYKVPCPVSLGSVTSNLIVVNPLPGSNTSILSGQTQADIVQAVEVSYNGATASSTFTYTASLTDVLLTAPSSIAAKSVVSFTLETDSAPVSLSTVEALLDNQYQCSLPHVYGQDTQTTVDASANPIQCYVDDLPPGLYNFSVVRGPGVNDSTARLGRTVHYVNSESQLFQQDDWGVAATTYIMPTIQSVAPEGISSNGGVFLTITGAGFGAGTSSVVTLGSSGVCNVKSATFTKIVCETETGTPGTSTLSGGGLYAETYQGSLTTPVTVASMTSHAGYTAQTPTSSRVQTLPLAKDSFSDRYSELPLAEQFSGYLIPPVTGNYTFFCTASDFVDAYLGTAYGTRLCSASNSESISTKRFIGSGSDAPVGDVIWLTQGTRYRFRARYGASSNTSHYRIAMAVGRVGGLTQSPSNAVPHSMMVKSHAGKSSVSKSESFFFYVGTFRVFIGSVHKSQNCSFVSVKARLLAAFPLLDIDETIEEADNRCYWYLVFNLPKGPMDMLVDGATPTTYVNGSTDVFHDPCPPRLFEAVQPASASDYSVRVRVGGLYTAVTPTVAPIVVKYNVTEAAPSLTAITPSSLYEATGALATLEINATGLEITNKEGGTQPVVLFTHVDATMLEYSCGDVVVRADNQSLTCVAPEMAAGYYTVMLRYPLTGSSWASTLYFHHQFSVSTVVPDTSGRYADVPVTIGGRNFPQRKQDIVVKVAGVFCDVTEIVSLTQFVCVVPAMPVNTTALGVTPIVAPSTFELSVYANVSNPIYNNRSLEGPGTTRLMRFVYDLGTEPFIESLSPVTGDGGSPSSLTLIGTNFVDAQVDLCLAGTTVCLFCYPDLVNVTKIICTARSLDAGTYTVLVRTPSGGVSNNNLTYTSQFQITDISPKSSSPNGGGIITITGQGFSTAAVITLGDAPCTVTSLSSTQVVCTAAASTKTNTQLPVKMEVALGGTASCWVEGGCYFAFYTTGKIPYVSAVNPRSGQANLVTFTGVNFPESGAGTVAITIGSVPCALVVSEYAIDPETEDATFSCQLAYSTEAGTADVKVDVIGFGVVGFSRVEIATFTFTISVLSSTPTQGSVAGGRMVTIQGTGFGPTTVFTIATRICVYGTEASVAGTYVNSTSAVCETGSMTALEDRTGGVSASAGGISATCAGCTFSYALTKTLRIQQISPQSGVEGDFVNITGINFAVADQRDITGIPEANLPNQVIRITVAGTDVVEFSNATSSIVNMTIPATPAIQAPVIAWTPFGKAWNTRSQNLQVHPTLTTINTTTDTPKALSSAGGGHNLTVYGNRFWTKATDVVKVTVCSNECTITSVGYGKVECVSPPQLSRQSINSRPTQLPRNAKWLTLESFSDASLVAPIIDGDTSTFSTVTRSVGTGLVITLAFGEFVYAYVLRAEIFVPSGQEALLIGTRVETSSDALTWTTVATFREVHSAWNVMELNAYTNTRFLRISAGDAIDTLQISEVRVYGTLGDSTSGDICPLVLSVTAPGSSTVSTCTERPVQCANLDDQVIYSDLKTPIVNKISPPAGTTLGGTLVTLTGSNFPTTTAMTIYLDGVPCVRQYISSLSLTCLAGPKVDATVGHKTEMFVPGMGYAVINANPFYYGDRWSESATWLGDPFPLAGDIVVIPEKTVVILDVSPPPLTAIIVRGILTVDPSFNGELQADYIFVDGGSFLAGTSDHGLSQSLNITLTKTYSESLPVYGETVLAVDDGVLSLSTDFAITLRTTISETAKAGSASITLSSFISSWSVGDLIGISSTSMNNEESEIHTISSISTNSAGLTIFGLAAPLKHDHYGAQESVFGLATTIDTRANVVRLTHSVKVQGPSDAQTTGHGGHVLVRGRSEVTMSDIEFRNMGQRGVENRHPVTLDHVGVMLGSTIRSNSIHSSVNRGIVLKGTYHATLSENVIFDTEGHGIMLAGGRCRYNTLTSNYVYKSKVTAGLDTTVANFYISHPTNDVRGNIAGGAQHSGYWYHFEPIVAEAGTVCPDQGALGVHLNNVAFGSSFYGMWVYPQHVPRTVECGVVDSTINAVTATTVTLFTAFHNGRAGANLVGTGGYTMTRCTFAANGDMGLGILDTIDTTVTVSLSHFIAHTTASESFFTPFDSVRGVTGVGTPAADGLLLTNNSFYFYAPSNVTAGAHTAIRTCYNSGPCTARGGYTVTSESARFVNTTNRLSLDGPAGNDMVVDNDGTLALPLSLIDVPYTILPAYGHLAGLPGCAATAAMASGVAGVSSVNGIACMACNSSYAFHRVTLSSITPSSITNQTFTTIPLTVKSGFTTQVWPFIESVDGGGYVMILPSGTIPGTEEDVNWLNFTTSATDTSDWSEMLVEVSYANSLKSTSLNVLFGFLADLVRVDVFQRTFYRALPNLATRFMSALSPSASVVDTFYETAKVTNITNDPTHCFLDLGSKRFTIIFSGSATTATEQVQVSTLLCASTGCIKMMPPVDPPATFNWADSRAWNFRVNSAGEQIGEPVAGDDIIIPPGLTLELTQDTPVLRSLVVQGTLLVKQTGNFKIDTSYLVVYRGTLKIGELAAPFEGNLDITLHTTAVGPLGISTELILQPGTLAVFGAVSIVGYSKGVQWTKLKENFFSGSDLNVQDAISRWLPGDELAISSGTYRGSDSEENIYAGSPNQGDGRGFILANNIEKYHIGQTADVSETIQLTLASEVANLNRLVKVQGSTGNSNVSREGCRMLFGEYGADSTFAASGIVYNLELRYCGKQNNTNVTGSYVSQGALEVLGVNRNTLTIAQSTVHHSLSHAIYTNDTTKLTLMNNVLFDSKGSTLLMGTGDGNTISKNLVFGTRFPDWMWEESNQYSPYALCSYDSRVAINKFSSNVAGGSDSEGFCVQLPNDCSNGGDNPYSILNNEAHSNVIGFFTTHSTQGQACVGMKGTNAWKNAYAGIYAAINSSLNFSTLIATNNHIDLLAAGEGSGTAHILDSTIGGRMDHNVNDCTQVQCFTNVFDSSCAERANILGDGRSFFQGEIGVLLAPYQNKTRTADYSRDPAKLPIHSLEPDSRAALSGALTFIGTNFILFQYGRDFGTCSGSTAIVTEGMSTLPLPTASFSNTTWVDMVADARLYFHNPSNQWSGRTMCDGSVCDSLHHVAVHDTDGSFLELGSLGTVTSNYVFTALRQCALHEANNAYYCSNVHYLELQVENLDADSLVRSISPFKMQDQDFLAQNNAHHQPPDCATLDCPNPTYLRPGIITTAIQAQRTYIVDFGDSPPRRSLWSGRSCQMSATTAPPAVLLRITIDTLLQITVWDVTSAPKALTPTSNQITMDQSAGTHYFEAQDQRLYLLVPCETKVEVHQLVSADVGLRLQLDIEYFVANAQSTFLADLATFLQVPASRLSFREVFPGSTVVVFRITAVDSATYDSTDAAVEVNSHVMRIISSTSAELTSALSVEVLEIVSIVWATGTPALTSPPSIPVGISPGMIATVIVCAVVTFFILIGLLFLLYKRILGFKDVDQGAPKEADVAFPDFNQPAFDDTGMGDQGEDLRPRVDVALKSLKIRMMDDDDDQALMDQQRMEGNQQGGGFGDFGQDHGDDDDDDFSPPGANPGFQAFGGGGGGATGDGPPAGFSTFGGAGGGGGRIGRVQIGDDDEDF